MLGLEQLIAADGSFEYRLPDGRYWVHVVGPGLFYREPEQWIVDGGDLKVEVAVEPQLAVRLHCPQLDPAWHREDLSVHRWDSPMLEGEGWQRRFRGGSEPCEADLRQPGVIRYRVDHSRWNYILVAFPGYLPEEIPIPPNLYDLERGLDLDLDLQPAAQLELRPKTARPVQDGETWHCVQSGEYPEHVAQSASVDGRIRFLNLRPGLVEIYRKANEYAPVGEVTLRLGEATVFEY